MEKRSEQESEPRSRPECVFKLGCFETQMLPLFLKINHIWRNCIFNLLISLQIQAFSSLFLFHPTHSSYNGMIVTICLATIPLFVYDTKTFCDGLSSCSGNTYNFLIAHDQIDII